MQSQQQTKGELMGEVRGKRVSFTIKDVSSNGFKLETTNVGEATGKLQGPLMETNIANVKTDGTSDYETKGIVMAGQDLVVYTGRGKSWPSGPGTIGFDGDIRFVTQSPRLSWINNKEIWVEGTANQAEQTFTAKACAKK